jgi:hypothetical protein
MFGNSSSGLSGVGEGAAAAYASSSFSPGSRSEAPRNWTMFGWWSLAMRLTS